MNRSISAPCVRTYSSTRRTSSSTFSLVSRLPGTDHIIERPQHRRGLPDHDQRHDHRLLPRGNASANMLPRHRGTMEISPLSHTSYDLARDAELAARLESDSILPS